MNRACGVREGRSIAFARTTISSDRKKRVALTLGFSDNLTLFLNGEPVYASQNGWEKRYPGYMGLLKPNDEKLFIPLGEGENELIFAVTDDLRFGWGFAARIKPLNDE